MKKKVVLIALIVSLITILAMVFTACTVDTGKEDETATMPTAEEILQSVGDNSIIEFKVKNSYGDGKTEPTVEEYVEKVVHSGQYTYLEKNGEKFLVKETGGAENIVYMADESGKYTSLSFEYEYNPLDKTFLIVAGDDVKYKTKESTTVLEKACTKYTGGKNVDLMIVTYKTTEEWYIDDQSGACLKHVKDKSEVLAGNSDLAYESFECTKWVKNDATAASFITAEIAKIELAPLDKSKFVEIGIGSTAADIPEFDGTYIGSGDDFSGNYTAYYTIAGYDAGDEKIEALAQAFYAAGAQYYWISTVETEDSIDRTYGKLDPTQKLSVGYDDDNRLFKGCASSVAPGDGDAFQYAKITAYFEEGVWSVRVCAYKTTY